MNQSIEELQKQGFEVISPRMSSNNRQKDWDRVLYNLEEIRSKNVIVLFPGWENNPRSMFEVYYAVETGKILIDHATQKEIRVTFSRIYLQTHTINNENEKRRIKILPGFLRRWFKIY